jgi:ribosomal protein L32
MSIKKLIEAAWECGYYAATLEKAKLTSGQRAEYDELHKAAIARRKRMRDGLKVLPRLEWCAVCQEFSLTNGYCEMCVSAVQAQQETPNA